MWIIITNNNSRGTALGTVCDYDLILTLMLTCHWLTLIDPKPLVLASVANGEFTAVGA